MNVKVTTMPIDPKTGLSLIGIIALTWLGWSKGMDVAMSIALICGATGAAHAYQTVQCPLSTATKPVNPDG